MADWVPVTSGRSGAQVWRGPGVHRTVHDPAKLAGEAARLTWLGRHGIPCPAVVSLDDDGLTTTALPGRPAHELPQRLWPPTTAAHARVLRDLHGLPLEGCPFDETLATTLPRARRAARTGAVGLVDLDHERRGWSAARLLDALDATAPPDEDLVVCHGDPTCINVLLDDDGEVSGILDVDRLGVADRCRDLAIATRSVRGRLGQSAAEVLLTTYGHRVDPDRLAFYQLLDEFF